MSKIIDVIEGFLIGGGIVYFLFQMQENWVLRAELKRRNEKDAKENDESEF